ncbi:MAG: hypothetical protein PHY92_04595 [Alphaproteobacteria bacterium]|nr:hypothetical protein [Alphaproteobacteria bacterium]
MSKEKFLNNLFQWGVLTTIIAVALPDFAFAQTAGTVLNTIRQQEVSAVPPILSAVAYTGGAVLAISGALKLKQHAENPAQEKMAPGIARLLAGGGLAVLPMLLNTMQKTTHMDTGSTFTALTPGF